MGLLTAVMQMAAEDCCESRETHDRRAGGLPLYCAMSLNSSPIGFSGKGMLDLGQGRFRVGIITPLGGCSKANLGRFYGRFKLATVAAYLV